MQHGTSLRPGVTRCKQGSLGHALEFQAKANERLADEYDAAQERGEVADGREGNSGRSPVERPATVADLGLTRKAVHEARQVRDAEKASPGIVKRIAT